MIHALPACALAGPAGPLGFIKIVAAAAQLENKNNGDKQYITITMNNK